MRTAGSPGLSTAGGNRQGVGALRPPLGPCALGVGPSCGGREPVFYLFLICILKLQTQLYVLVPVGTAHV